MSEETVGTSIEGETPERGPVTEAEELTISEVSELERTLGLSGGFGIDTMIGAGIFLYPGLAGLVTMPNGSPRLLLGLCLSFDRMNRCGVLI